MLTASVQLQRGAFNLDVVFEQRQRVTGVFGPSGAGKSTLMHLVAGLERPDSGRISFNGTPMVDTAAGIFVPSHRRRIGIVFQDDRLFPHRSVEGNLRYGERRRDARSAEPLIQFGAVVDLLSLSHLLQRRVAGLSGGERQRIALGRALLSSPRLLLLDEPLASLDHALKRQILPFLRRIRDAVEIPMLYVSHDLSEILQLTGDLVIIDAGRVVAAGDIAQLTRDSQALDVIHSRGLTNVLAATVIGHEIDDGLTRLSINRTAGADTSKWPPSPLAAPPSDADIGLVVFIAIRPEDIALANAKLTGVSIQNQLQGIVVRCTEHAGRSIIEIDVGSPLLAEVSLRAVAELGLRPGWPVWCLIKSNAIRYLDGCDAGAPSYLVGT